MWHIRGDLMAQVASGAAGANGRVFCHHISAESRTVQCFQMFLCISSLATLPTAPFIGWRYSEIIQANQLWISSCYLSLFFPVWIEWLLLSELEIKQVWNPTWDSENNLLRLVIHTFLCLLIRARPKNTKILSISRCNSSIQVQVF